MKVLSLTDTIQKLWQMLKLFLKNVTLIFDLDTKRKGLTPSNSKGIFENFIAYHSKVMANVQVFLVQTDKQIKTSSPLSTFIYLSIFLSLPPYVSKIGNEIPELMDKQTDMVKPIYPPLFYGGGGVYKNEPSSLKIGT